MEFEIPGNIISHNEVLFIAGIDPLVKRKIKYRATKEGELKEGESMELIGKVSFTVSEKTP